MGRFRIAESDASGLWLEDDQLNAPDYSLTPISIDEARELRGLLDGFLSGAGEQHRHEPPPGYLGAPPVPADPHDHRTSPPVTPEPPSHTHAMPGLVICEDCWRENPRASSFPAVAIGARCERHTIQPWRAGEPWISLGIEDVLPLSAAKAAPRWHEIATEGLPATWTFVSTWDAECPNGGVGYLQLHLPDDAEDENAAPVWHDDHGHRAERGVTHWHPLPGPPVPRAVQGPAPSAVPPERLARIGLNNRRPERCPTCRRWRPGSCGYPRDAKPHDRCQCIRGGA